MTLKVNDLFDNRYRLVKRLSDEGATADVWLAIDTLTLDKKIDEDTGAVADEDSGARVAIKIYRPKNALDVEGESLFVKEFKTAYNCQHENLLTPTGYGIANDIPYLVMPYCSKGSVENLVGKMKDEKEIWKFLQQTAAGLAYLHSCKPPIIHQDIKPGNILIDDNGNYRITDFGISVKRDYSNDGFLDDKDSGTTDYMPPERFEDRSNSLPIPESDVWSLGATAFELITGSSPFGENGGKAQRRNTPIPKISVQLPKELKQILYSCLSANDTNRPTASVLAELSKNKATNRNRIKTIAIMCSILAILLAGAFIWGGLSKDSKTHKDFIEAFIGTWVYDYPDGATSEKIKYDESGFFHAIYHQYITGVDENLTGVYRIDTISGKPHLIARYQIKDGRRMSLDWTITAFNELQVSYIINKTPENNAFGQRFTYSKLLNVITVKKRESVPLPASTFIPNKIISYNGSDKSLLKEPKVENPQIISYKSHDTTIAVVDLKNRLITGIKSGQTYIDVVTTKGTAVIEVNVSP